MGWGIAPSYIKSLYILCSELIEDLIEILLLMGSEHLRQTKLTMHLIFWRAVEVWFAPENRMRCCLPIYKRPPFCVQMSYTPFPLHTRHILSDLARVCKTGNAGFLSVDNCQPEVAQENFSVKQPIVEEGVVTIHHAMRARMVAETWRTPQPYNFPMRHYHGWTN